MYRFVDDESDCFARYDQDIDDYSYDNSENYSLKESSLSQSDHQVDRMIEDVSSAFPSQITCSRYEILDDYVPQSVQPAIDINVMEYMLDLENNWVISVSDQQAFVYDKKKSLIKVSCSKMSQIYNMEKLQQLYITSTRKDFDLHFDCFNELSDNVLILSFSNIKVSFNTMNQQLNILQLEMKNCVICQESLIKLQHLANLRQLNVSNSEGLRFDGLCLPNLRILIANSCNLDKIPNIETPELLELQLNSNHINNFKNLHCFTRLYKLDLGSNNFTKTCDLKLPKNICILNLNGNCISSLKCFRSCQQIKHLDISLNNIFCPAELYHLSSLPFKGINLSLNPIQKRESEQQWHYHYNDYLLAESFSKLLYKQHVLQNRLKRRQKAKKIHISHIFFGNVLFTQLNWVMSDFVDQYRGK